MTGSDSLLTKTCSQCGLQKPLSAFLQLAGPEGATYGNLCASCRKAGVDEGLPHQDHEETTSSSSGFKIDSKSKIAEDIGKQEGLKQTEETYYQEREKNEEKSKSIFTQKEEIKKQEKKQREKYLKSRSFLSVSQRPKDQRAIDKLAQERAAQQNSQLEHTQKQQLAIQEEQKQNEFDLRTGPFIDTQIAGKEKAKGETIRRFAARLGKDTPLGRALAQITSETKPKKDETKPRATKGAKDMADYIERTWRPKSK